MRNFQRSLEDLVKMMMIISIHHKSNNYNNNMDLTKIKIIFRINKSNNNGKKVKIMSKIMKKNKENIIIEDNNDYVSKKKK